jgi:oxygen-dependent protoporphyrinogen oxidase
MNDLIVIGGGIAGLASAYYAVKKSGGEAAVTLLEKADYWGGKIITDRVRNAVPGGDFVIEGGPDTFVVTKPWAVQLCKELGITGRLRGTNPDHKKTYILKNDTLHELPGGLTMMIPTEFGSMLRTGLLSWPAKARMGMDFLLPPVSENGDESLGHFVTRRLGRSAYENLIEPLMSGIYAGDGDRLSLQATLPYLRDLELKHGGLVKGALAARRARSQRAHQNGKSGDSTPGSRSIFLTPITGLAELVEALIDYLANAGVVLSLETSVREVVSSQDGYNLHLTNGELLPSRNLILATPAYISGDLIAGFAPDLAAELHAIEYVSTATVTLAYHESGLPRPLDGYGYVIPRREGRHALACTWSSTKFPHRAPDGYALLRVFVGRAGQEADIPWDDAGLLGVAQGELRRTLGITTHPLLTRIFRWDKAMSQYNIGHPARLERIDSRLDSHPGLALAGNGYRGIGIPDCIHSGELAVDRVLMDPSPQSPIPYHTEQV